MKKNKIFNIIFIFALLALITYIGIGHYFNYEFSANQIFVKASQYVVEIKAESESGVSYGSGVIINNEAQVITNAHVVTFMQAGETKLFDSYWARFASEEDFVKLELIRFDKNSDLAILNFETMPENFGVAKISTKQLKTGNVVYAVGNSQNYGISITQGIISIPRLNLIYETLERTAIQCDLVITGGNSGGALLNDFGELIGITTFRTKDAQGNIVHGLSYSIPIDILNEFLNN